jgi:predicted RNA-binding protein with RPS1 domain
VGNELSIRTGIDSIKRQVETALNKPNIPNNGMSYFVARVTYILLDDTDKQRFEKYGGWKGIGTIECKTFINNEFNEDIINAAPVNPNTTLFPLVNEIVLVFRSITYKAQKDEDNFESQYYYSNIIPVWNSPEHNAAPNKKTQSSDTGIFKATGKVKRIIKSPGDMSIEGRSGNIIRLGSYINGFNSPFKGDDRSPLLTIVNGIRDTKDPKIKKYEEIPVSKNSDVEKILSRYEKTEITEDESEIETKFIDMEPIMQSNFIGKGGQNIKNMSKHFNVKLYVLEDKVSITGSKINIQKVLEYLKVALKTPVVGEVYDAMVVNTHSFGTFFALNPFYSGLLHIKNYDPVKDIFVPGDIIRVKVDKYISPKQIQLFLVQKAPEPEDVDNYIKEHLYKGLTEQLHAPIEVFSKFIKRKIEYKVSGVRNEDEIVYTVKISLK